MAHHKSAIKRIKTAEKQRQVNRTLRTHLRSLIKDVRSAESKEDAQNALALAVPFLDKMATRHLIHRNKAANLKSKLTRRVNAL